MVTRLMDSHFILASLDQGNCPKCGQPVKAEPLEDWEIDLNWYARLFRFLRLTPHWWTYPCYSCGAMHVVSHGKLGKSAAYAGEMDESLRDSAVVELEEDPSNGTRPEL